MIAADYYTHQPTDSILAVIGVIALLFLIGAFVTDSQQYRNWRRKR